MKKLALPAICLCLVLSSCGREADRTSAPAPTNAPPAGETRAVDPALLSGARALERTARLVAVSPRCSGTEGAQRAAAFLLAELKEAGMEAEQDEFEETTPAGAKKFRNVIARIPGGGKGLVVVGSHYDTKAGISADFQGANDSGSSSGLLLELASVLHKAGGVNADVEIVFLDGEECLVSYGPHDGLHGSRRHARRLRESGLASNVVGVLILDMIGDRDLSAGIPRNSAGALCKAVLDSAREEGVRARFALLRKPILDDHVPFQEEGMPAIDIIDFEYGSEPGLNDYWHTPQDTLDKLDAASLETVGRVVVRALNKLERR